MVGILRNDDGKAGSLWEQVFYVSLHLPRTKTLFVRLIKKMTDQGHSVRGWRVRLRPLSFWTVQSMDSCQRLFFVLAFT